MKIPFLRSALTAAGGLALLLVQASPAMADYQTTVLKDSPAGYWRLGDGSSATVATNIGSLGASANGAYIGGAQSGQPGAITGDNNTAASFDGSTGYVQVPYNASLNPNGPFSIECWAMSTVDDGNYHCPLSSRDIPSSGGTSGYMFYQNPANNWAFWTGAAPGFQGVDGVAVDVGQWDHLVGVFDGTRIKLYVNGVLTATAIPATFQPNLARSLRIGAGANEGPADFFFDGDIDEVAVYTNALPESSILAHFVTGAGTDPTAVAPVDVSDPQGETNYLGQAASMAVAATGSLPLSYQWYFNGSPIANATNTAFAIPSCQVTNSGAYTVIITNSGGRVTSAVATLLVQNITMPTITAQPQSVTLYAGGTANFAVSAAGSTDLHYQWLFNNADLVGATNTTLTVRDLRAGNAGSYTVIVTNILGAVTSSVAALTVTAVASNSYEGIVMSDEPAAYWKLNEVAGSVATDYAGGFDGVYSNGVTLGLPGSIVGDADTSAGFDGVDDQKVEVPYSSSLNTSNFTVELWAMVTGGDGTYRSPLTSRMDVNNVWGGYNFYAAQDNTWQFWTVNGGGFSVLSGPAVQDGAWTHLVASYDGTTTSFYVNGVLVNRGTLAIVPNTSAVLRIGGGATEESVGTFFFIGDIDDVAYYNTVLPLARVLAHYEAGLGATTPPSITVQPTTQAALVGGTVSLSVTAVGSVPLAYQWQYFGTNLVSTTNNLGGATNATLVLDNVQPANGGNYQVIVSNPVGSVTSIVATLTVVSVPSTTYSNLIASDGAIAYWPLNETSGTNAFDNIGGRIASYSSLTGGLLLGQPGPILGESDDSAGFAATNDTLLEVTNYDATLNTAQFSIECWARATGADGTYRAAVSSRNDLPQRGYILYATGGNQWQFWTGTGSGWVSIGGPTVQDGTWVHLVGTFDGTNKQFFIDGQLIGADTNAFSIDDQVGVFRMGAGKSESVTGDYFFQGDLAQVAYYTNALSRAQVLTHYGLGLKPVAFSMSAIPGAVILTWSAGVLESASSLGGGFRAVSGATSPYTNSIGNGTSARFFRVRVQ